MSIKKKKKNPKLLQRLGNGNLVFRPAFLRGDKIRNQLGFAFGFIRPTTARSEEQQGPQRCSPKISPRPLPVPGIPPGDVFLAQDGASPEAISGLYLGSNLRVQSRF